MSDLDNDQLVLQEYAAWVEKELVGDRDTSPQTYLRAREGEHNARRIADALRLIDNALSEADYPSETRPHLESVRDALIDGREFIITSALGGPTTREFV